MNNNDLLERYGKSWFNDFLPAERIITPGQKKAAEAEYERDPAKALLENVDEARDAVEGTRARLTRARQDELFDVDRFRNATKSEQKRWIAALDVVRGDYIRAKSELAHWREYVKWATEKQRAKVALLEGDTRLPAEAR